MENQISDNDMQNKNEGKSLSYLLNNGYETNAVEYIKKGFEIFKKDIGSYIGFIIVVVIAQMIVSMIPFVKGFVSTLLGPVFVGGFIVAKKIDKNEEYTFSSFFDGTKNYVNLLLVMLIPNLIVGVVILIIGGWAYFKMAFLGIKPNFNPTDIDSLIKMSGSMTGMAGRASLAGLISLGITVLFLFATFFVLFENFEPIKALDVSRKIISKKFINWIGFIFLLVVFNIAGAICLVVGLLITIPSTICALYVAYEDVVGLDLRD